MNTNWAVTPAPAISAVSAIPTTAAYARRLGAMLVDLAILAVLALIMATVFGAMHTEMLESLADALDQNDAVQLQLWLLAYEPQVQELGAQMFMFLFAGPIAYWLICATPLTDGRTIGKLALGLRVVRDAPRP